jgi:DNA-binding SARP family transcriptional activator
MRVKTRIPSGQRAGTPARGLCLNLLDGFELHCDGQVVHLPMSSQRLLCYLALHDRPLLRVHVAGMLWPDATEDHARGNLRSALWRLNRADLTLVHATSSHLRLASNVVLDVRETTMLARCVLDHSLDVRDLDPTAATLGGELLPDWYDDWVVLERERFRQLRLHALEALCERLTKAGRFGQAAEAGLAAVAGEPLRESAHRVLIKLYLAEGNRREAVRQYRLCADLVREELGMEPSMQFEDFLDREWRITAS